MSVPPSPCHPRRCPPARLLSATLAAAVAVLLAITGSLGPAGAASPPLVPGESTGNDPDEEWWEGITIPTEGVLPAEEVHPSLYGGEDAIAGGGGPRPPRRGAPPPPTPPPPGGAPAPPPLRSADRGHHLPLRWEYR
jgi:hypothetical protein